MESDGGNDTSALPGWRTTNLESIIDNHYSAQTALAIGEGGLPRMKNQGRVVLRWFTFQLALIPQPIKPDVRHLSHAVGVR